MMLKRASYCFQQSQVGEQDRGDGTDGKGCHTHWGSQIAMVKRRTCVTALPVEKLDILRRHVLGDAYDQVKFF